MRYRAQLIGMEVNDRPVQSFSQSLNQIQQWAQVTANKYGHMVQIFETSEQFVRQVSPTPTERR